MVDETRRRMGDDEEGQRRTRRVRWKGQIRLCGTAVHPLLPSNLMNRAHRYYHKKHTIEIHYYWDTRLY